MLTAKVSVVQTPTVEVVSAWYNEEILAPIFLRHYSWADRIHILYDSDTNDGTLSVLEGDPRVEIHPITYPNGIDWEIKSRTVNEIAMGVGSEWVIAVDADEFIWSINGEPMKEWLGRQKGNVVWAAMWAVYRNREEKDIDERSVMEQRRHGDTTPGVTYGMSGWVKPCVAKVETGIEWTCGIHSYVDSNPRIRVCEEFLVGAHWAMADPELAVRRRMAQSKRQSENNVRLGHGYQNFNVTEVGIRDECERHADEPKLF